MQQQQQTHSSGIEVYVQQQAVEPYMQVLWSPTAPGVYAAATPMQVSVCSLLASNCAAGSPSSAADRFYPPEDSRIMGPSSSKFIPSWFKVGTIPLNGHIVTLKKGIVQSIAYDLASTLF